MRAWFHEAEQARKAAGALLASVTIVLALGAGDVASAAMRSPVLETAYTGNAMPEAVPQESVSDTASETSARAQDENGGDAAASDDPAEEKSVTKPAPALPVLRDLSKLPEPVRRMRQKIVEAARSGDIERLRPLLGKGDAATQLAISGQEGDPIAYLKSLSGDPHGREVLAILLDVLDTGYVDMDPGSENEAYVWPYFFATPLDTLTAPQQVELLRLVTAGDLDAMEAKGQYNFFRVGIAPDGSWTFFVAGD